MRKIALSILVSLLAAAATAAPLKWTLSGVKFSDGGTASGSFVYDATTNTYSAVDVKMTGGTNTFFDQKFGFACTSPCAFGGATPFSYLVVLLPVSPDSGDLMGLAALPLFFAPALTDQGGTSNLGQSIVGTCTNATCQAIEAFPPPRMFTAGTVSATAPCIPGGGRQCVVIPVASASDARATGRKRPL